MRIFKKSKLVILSSLLGLAILPGYASANANINAQANISSFDTLSITTNFDGIKFGGTLSQSEPVKAQFTTLGLPLTIGAPNYKVTSGKNFDVYISASNFKEYNLLGPITDLIPDLTSPTNNELDVKRLQVSANDNSFTSVTSVPTVIDSGSPTGLLGSSRLIDFQLDLSDNDAKYNDTITVGDGDLLNLLSSLDGTTTFTTNITLSVMADI